MLIISKNMKKIYMLLMLLIPTFRSENGPDGYQTHMYKTHKKKKYFLFFFKNSINKYIYIYIIIFIYFIYINT